MTPLSYQPDDERNELSLFALMMGMTPDEWDALGPDESGGENA